MTNAKNPMTATQPLPRKPQGSLEEYANGVNSVNIELQRQNAAYGHFRSVLLHIDAIVADSTFKNDQALPFVVVRFPQDSGTPGEMTIDLNTLTPQTLATFREMFVLLAQGAGERLINAWDNIHRLADATKPIIDAAKQVTSDNRQQ